MTAIRVLACVAAMALLTATSSLLAEEPAAKPAAEATAQDVSGEWTWESPGWGGQTAVFVLSLKQDGNALTGTLAGPRGEPTAIEDGKVENGTITFKVTNDMRGRKAVTTYTGTVAGDALKCTTQTVTTGEVEAARKAQ